MIAEVGAFWESQESSELQNESLQMIEKFHNRPILVQSVYVPRSVPRVAGLKPQTRWHAEVTDFQALVSFAAEHPESQPREGFVVPNRVRLNEEARKLKGGMKIPGVKAVSEIVL